MSDKPGTRSRSPILEAADEHRLIAMAIVALAYFGLAKAGLAFAFANPSVTAVWAPTGLALAAVLLIGYRAWPAVAAGALLANITTDAPLISVAGITVGNTLEALTGAFLLERFAGGFRYSLERTRDVLALVLFGAALSTMVSATIGVTSLIAGGAADWGDFGSTWRTWWLGDMGGDLILAPLLLVIASRTALGMNRNQVLELAASLLALAGLGVLIFSADEPLAFILFPALFWIAIRFRQIGATMASFLLAVIGVWFTSRNIGQFAIGSPDADLLRSQAFVGVAAVTGLLAAAVRTERQRAEEETLERQRAAEVLRSLSQELEWRVKERTRELEASNRELEAFSYSVSHDLQAPLRAIDGYSRMALEDFGEQLDPKGKELLEQVRLASQRMGTLIDGMLVLSRLSRRELRRERVDLSGLAHEIVDELREREPKQSAAVEIEEGLEAVGDTVLLRTALENLLGNAWKFTALTSGAGIQFSATQQNGRRVYVVRDNGVGFDPAYAERLFVPFERFHGDRQFAGSGVGLATVQRIVNRHGGSVWAEGKPGEGSAFYFVLPAEPAESST